MDATFPRTRGVGTQKGNVITGRSASGAGFGMGGGGWGAELRCCAVGGRRLIQ